MSVRRATVHAKWIIGRVIGTKMQKTAKVRVTRLVLDPYLLKVSSSPLESTEFHIIKMFYTSDKVILFSQNL